MAHNFAWSSVGMEGLPKALYCGVEFVDGRPYEEIVKIAKDYIDSLGGFEKFAEWGLIR